MKLIITLLITICSLTLKAQWSKTDEVMMTVKIFNLGKTFGLTDEQAYEFTVCAITKFKVSLPNPNTQSVSGVSAKEIGRRIGLECMAKYQLNMKWTKDSEDLIRRYFDSKSDTDMKMFSIDAKNKLVDCVIDKLKTKYPNGFTKIPEAEAEIIGKECAESVMKSYN
jgi:hypothetical protein